MKKILFLFLLGVSQIALAQHSVMNFSDGYVDMNHKSLLIIPFEPFMYQSDINRELHEENQLNSDEICKSFAKGIDQSFQYIFRNKCDVSSFYYLDESKRFQDLSFVFQNRKLEYVKSNPVEENSIGKIKGLFSKKSANKEKEGIQNGQIVSLEDPSEKYMKAIANDILIDSLKRQFGTDFVLFINQLDIKNQYGTVYEMANMEYKRKIDLHYTLYSSTGKILSTGISSTSFPATENDIRNIISEYFPVLAQNIYDDLFSTNLN